MVVFSPEGGEGGRGGSLVRNRCGCHAFECGMDRDAFDE